MDNHLSDNQIETVLQHNVIGHLGCSLGDSPYVVPMCYAYDGTNIYGRTYEGLKLDMLRNNPKVCFQVADIENGFAHRRAGGQRVLSVSSDRPRRRPAGTARWQNFPF